MRHGWAAAFALSATAACSSGSSGLADGGTSDGAGGTGGAAGSSGAGGGVGGASGSGGAGADGGASGGGSGGTGANGGAAGGGTGGAGAVADVHFIGRFDRTDAAGPKAEWSGSAIATRFSGPGIDVDFAGSANQFQVVVDGAPTSVLAAGDGHFTVVSGLADADHDLLLVKRTEAFYYPIQFLSFTPHSGRPLIATPRPHQRRIEFVGDSITCGYGADGPDATCPFTPETENAYLAYGSVAARSLAADAVLLCWSGHGISRNYDGTTDDLLPELYPRTLPTETNSPWSFTELPDAIVINLGTNDFAQGDPGAAFEAAYVSFVAQLRARAPGAEIVFLLGPMLSGPSLDAARTYLNGALTTLAGQGDGHVSLVEVAGPDSSEGYGCDYHPSVATHARVATTLATALRAKLGW